MYSANEIKQILTKYNIRPLPQLGQHFLIDKRVKDLFFKFASINKDDIIIEVGPGLGALTFEIAKKAGKIFAIEKDKKLAEILKQQVPANVEIICADILKINIADNLKKPYKIISDVPYNISSPLLELFLTKVKLKPKLLILMFQKEFADKITLNKQKSSNLGIFVNALCQVKKIADISPAAFWPKPSVQSSLILLEPIKKPKLNDLTLAMIKKCFLYKRKKIASTLKKILQKSELEITTILKKAGINLNARPENLTIKDWQNFEKYQNKLKTQNSKLKTVVSLTR